MHLQRPCQTKVVIIKEMAPIFSLTHFGIGTVLKIGRING